MMLQGHLLQSECIVHNNYDMSKHLILLVVALLTGQAKITTFIVHILYFYYHQ